MIAPVSVEEYKALQAAVRRKVDLDQIDRVVRKLNRFIGVSASIEGNIKFNVLVSFKCLITAIKFYIKERQ